MKTKNIITLYPILAVSSAFAQSDPSCRNCIPKKDTLDGRKVYQRVEKWPEFRGGMVELTKFMSSTLSFPAYEEGEIIVATVIVTFVVDAQGRIRNACVCKSEAGERLHPVEQAVLSVVEQMPDWIPGEHKGRAVAVRYSFPVRF